ncbi:MAG: GDSL-type esterase/lipase family protein [Candidatus Alcyoniella australis]|nr:GDSL-type esterase/lipase family protein [Candidatus Alcyoniella australis]
MRRVAFLAAAIIIGSALLIGALELLCRVTSLGDPPRVWPSRLAYQRVGPAFSQIPDEQGRIWCVGGGVSPIRPTLFPERKGPATFRVFVFGGSAAWGFGYYGGGSFPALLQRLLAQRYPQRDIEVINLAQVGYSSTQILARAREVLERYDPDLLVVYSGHNEGLELRAILARTQRTLDQIELRARWRKRSALYRALGKLSNLLLYRPNAPLERPAGILAANRPFSQRESTWIVERFAENLQRIATLAGQQGVPLILSTVVWNGEWQNERPDRCVFCEPIEPRAIPDEMPAAQVRQALAADWAFSMLRRGRRAWAAQLLRDLQSADARYLRLKCALDGPDRDQALERLHELADELRQAGFWRSDQRLGVLYVDLLAALEQHDPHPLTRLSLQEAYRIVRRSLLPGLGDPTGREPYRLSYIAQLVGDEQTSEQVEQALLAMPLPTANPAINEAIRNATSESNAILIDTEQRLRALSPNSVVGYDLLLDYCHLNIRGALELALMIEEEIAGRELPGDPDPQVRPRLLARGIEGRFWNLGHDQCDIRWFVGVGSRPVLLYNPNPSLSWRAAQAVSPTDNAQQAALGELYAAYAEFNDNGYDPQRIRGELIPQLERIGLAHPQLQGLRTSQAWLSLVTGDTSGALSLLDRLDPQTEPDAERMRRWIEHAPVTSAE